ncbi:hypothetical protein [Streptomyces sp. NPDC087294]|uniref:hypothetical protein n=1 Tax=Streptomyces sp. NPDC087294 TaxID=3365777 RepID=UPI00382502FC
MERNEVRLDMVVDYVFDTVPAAGRGRFKMHGREERDGDVEGTVGQFALPSSRSGFGRASVECASRTTARTLGEPGCRRVIRAA